jgi:hypothetical protein
MGVCGCDTTETTTAPYWGRVWESHGLGPYSYLMLGRQEC